MKVRSRPIVILAVLFCYVLLQFLWWEILLVRQNGRIVNEQQKLIELSTSDPAEITDKINELHHRKKMQTLMIVSEGTVFLLLLLFGVYKIKTAKDKENELNNRQKNFFLSITHELKTPIAATKLQLQTMQKQALDEETRRQLIGNALNETERLNMLIDNVLLASRLESRELVYAMEKIDLSSLTRDTIERYYKPELLSGALQTRITPDIEVKADAFVFPSVITNLVDNGLKYSPAQKKIIVELLKDKQNCVLRISDNGAGIPDEDKPNIFNRFYRGSNEATRSTKGTGLGLYIVNYIVDNHKGKIRVKNNTPQGTIFEIKLDAV